ncbi:peroxiredoxin [Chloroflexota bacterium]
MLRRSRKKARQQAAVASSPLAPGTPAPDFELPATTGKTVSLSDYRGQPVVLVFYPADWSSVCGDQLALYNEVLPLFGDSDAQVLAISVDGMWCHKAFAENRNLQFPLLSDFEPKGAVAQIYGVYDAQVGHNLRALFVVDAEGIIRWNYVSPSNVNPGADGIISALESLDRRGEEHGRS